MNDNLLYTILIGPHTTEKSVGLSTKHNQVVFKVAKHATKDLVKKVAEKLFSVKVLAVRIVNIKGKVKNFKQVEGKRSGYKKAIISLAEGHEINLANFQ